MTSTVNKIIQISDDDGATWHTLPGNSGEFANEAGALPDSVFGSTFTSTFPGLLNWSISANALYKGFAGYEVIINISGAPTAITSTSTTNIVGRTYQLDAAVQRNLMLDSIVVKDNGVVVAASNIESINALHGQVTFVVGYTVTGPVTIEGDYCPMAAIGGARTFTLTQTADAIDDSTINSVQANSGRRTFSYGHKTVQLDVSGVFSLSNGFRSILEAREELCININAVGDGTASARGYFRMSTVNQSGDVNSLEEESISLNLSVADNALLLYPFWWFVTGTTTLSQAVVICLDAWQYNTTIKARYLVDGVNGAEGDVLVTDISYTGGLDSMNEFSVSLQGSGAVSAVP